MHRRTPWLLLCALWSAACEPREGRSCEAGESHCASREAQLLCENGRFVLTACRGPGGCARLPQGIACDFSKNRPGDVCASGEEGAAMCVAKDAMIVCRSGHYRAEACRGPRGCQRRAGRAACDTTRARAGDVCARAAEQACSIDEKELLVCRDGKMVSALFCRGPDGCRAEGSNLRCDLSRANVSDPCEPSMEGQHACSSDGASILACKAGKFTVDEPCKSGKRCNNEDGSVRCDKN